MKFDYGELVQILETAPLPYQPGKIGSVCGILVSDQRTSLTFGVEPDLIYPIRCPTDGVHLTPMPPDD